MDILKVVTEELSDYKKQIKEKCFEAANLVIYTDDKQFLLNAESIVKPIVEKIKKRIEVRATPELLLSESKTTQLINEYCKDAEITNIFFDKPRALVIIEAKKPGLVIGKQGEVLSKIKQETCWTPQVKRSPLTESSITAKIRKVLYADEKRKAFLNRVGKQIYAAWNPEKRKEWIRVTFLGGARQVGRSCILLQTPESKILLDCGLDVAAPNSEKFPLFEVPEFRPEEIDAVVISHAHLDHVGFVPYLYKLGYKGPCYMTEPTRDIAALLLLDYIGVSYKQAVKPIYKVEDVKKFIKHSITINYNQVTDITRDIRLTFYNAGHALGSALTHLNIGNGLHNLLYTADFKFIPTRLLAPAAKNFPRLETLIIEATYGSKQDVVPRRQEAEKLLIELIAKTLKKGGKVLIPVLGVGRAQEVILILEEAIKTGKLKKVPVYLDGMLYDVTAIHSAYPTYMNVQLRKRMFSGENPFSSDIFSRVGSPKEREGVIQGKSCIILATSGMLVGGASVEYFYHLADSARNAVLFVSYQAPNSLGRRVVEGSKTVKLDIKGKEEEIKVKALIEKIDGLTGHADRLELLNFVNQLRPSPKRVIVQHGEATKCLELASTIHKLNKIETNAPRNLETLRLK